jgi:hypothetical protein
VSSIAPADPTLSLSLSRPSGFPPAGLTPISLGQVNLGSRQTPFVSQPVQPGSGDTFQTQYAPETYAIVFGAGSRLSSGNVQPTYGGGDVPYFDHELEKIDLSFEGNATLTQPLPTFAEQALQNPAPQ